MNLGKTKIYPILIKIFTITIVFGIEPARREEQASRSPEWRRFVGNKVGEFDELRLSDLDT